MRTATTKKTRKSARHGVVRTASVTLGWLSVFAIIIGVSSARCYWALAEVMAAQ